MDTNKLKRFATEARNKIRQGVVKKLLALGFNEEGEPSAFPQQLQGATLYRGQQLEEEFYSRWLSLYEAIQHHGVRQVYEEVAYTWFNRLVAIRILQKNGFIDRVLTFDNPEIRAPHIVSEARQGRFPEMDTATRLRLRAIIGDPSKTYDQFALLITAFCQGNRILSTCFGAINDYTSLLLPDDILDADGFVDMLNRADYISDEDYRTTELLGWLYQFYISERKDDVFAKKGKFEADEIPAATQIFTPNWIVKYMVQNTLGRIWLDNNPDDTHLHKEWQYLVGDVSHVATGNTDNSRMCGETPHPLKYDELTELKVIDPACGSGHILLEAFDLLYDMYLSEFYSREEAITCIFTQNLVGIDLDTRAKQLAMFALLLKACQRDKSFLDVPVCPRVLDMPEAYDESLYGSMDEFIDYFCGDPSHKTPTDDDKEEIKDAFELMKDANTLGTIMKFNLSDHCRQVIKESLKYWTNETLHRKQIVVYRPAFELMLALTDKYACVIANPPYMGSGNMNEVLSKYVKENYAEGKADLATVFVQLFKRLANTNGCYAFIIPPSWLFLSAFESLRKGIIEGQCIESMLHLSRGVFGADFGSVATVIRNAKDENSHGTYFRLVERTFQEFDQKHLRMLFEQTLADHDFKYRFKDYSKDVESLPYSADGNRIYYPNVEQKNFEKIPGCPIGYWVGEALRNAFNNLNLEKEATPKKGLATTDNARFLRIWFEVSLSKVGFKIKDKFTAIKSNKKWFILNKGGGYRKWYGLNNIVINWFNDGEEIKSAIVKRYNGGSYTKEIRSENRYFANSITWSALSSDKLSARYSNYGALFDSAGSSMFPIKDERYTLAFVNSSIAQYIMGILNPTLNYGAGVMGLLPLIKNNVEDTENLVQQNISLSKQDWDSHETSWDFQRNELLSIADELVGDVSHVASETMCGETPHPLKFVNKKEYIHITGNNLPHWTQSDCVQFVTFRLADSLPQSKLQEMRHAKEQWLKEHPKPWDTATLEEYSTTIGNTMEKWIDAGYGECILKNVKVRTIVANAIMHFNGDRYDIHTFVIMPNHVHVLFSPRDGNLVQDIVGSWKKFSAHEINKALGRQGTVWERESFDHMVRNEDSYQAKLNYIKNNPLNLPNDSYTLYIVGDVSHVATKEMSHVATKDVSHVASETMCGGTPHPLSFSLEELVEQYKQKWERNFMQLHQNEEELNRQFISIYGLEDELTPDVPLDEITILQQGEISIE